MTSSLLYRIDLIGRLLDEAIDDLLEVRSPIACVVEGTLGAARAATLRAADQLRPIRPLLEGTAPLDAILAHLNAFDTPSPEVKS